MNRERPLINIEELTSEKGLREINKWLDEKLEEVFRGADSKTYAQFRAFMRRCAEGKGSDKSWLLDYHKKHFREFFKRGQEIRKEGELKKRLNG